jgi:hypothetical protein
MTRRTLSSGSTMAARLGNPATSLRARASYRPPLTTLTFKPVAQRAAQISLDDQQLAAGQQHALFLGNQRVTAAEHRASRTQKFQVWAEICNMGWQ